MLEVGRSAGHLLVTHGSEKTLASVIWTEFTENRIYYSPMGIEMDADAPATRDCQCDRGTRFRALIPSVDRNSQFLEEINQHVDSDESAGEVTDFVEEGSWRSQPEGGIQPPEAA
jgi:hypothetical protein